MVVSFPIDGVHEVSSQDSSGDPAVQFVGDAPRYVLVDCTPEVSLWVSCELRLSRMSYTSVAEHSFGAGEFSLGGFRVTHADPLKQLIWGLPAKNHGTSPTFHPQPIQRNLRQLLSRNFSQRTGPGRLWISLGAIL